MAPFLQLFFTWLLLRISGRQPLHIIPTVEMYARMAVYALSDGTVLINNPIAPTEETLQEIEDIFGEPGEAQGLTELRLTLGYTHVVQHGNGHRLPDDVPEALAFIYVASYEVINS